MAPQPPNQPRGLRSQQEAPPPPVIDNSVLKNKLQELTQKLGMPLPAFLTINEGSSYAPKFRTTVLVDGLHYTSQHSCANSAEREALRIAINLITGKDYVEVEGHPPHNQTGTKRPEKAKSPITSKFQAMAASSQPPNQAITECTSSKEQEEARNFTNVEGCPSIYQNPIYCKTILYEYSVKKKMNKPKYQTKCIAGFLPRFISYVDLNGEQYLGEEAESKKEAEQLAAQTAIVSLLGKDSMHSLGSDRSTLYLIIKSKEIIFDPFPPLKPLLCIEHGKAHTTTVRPPSTRPGSHVHGGKPLISDQERRGPSFHQQTEIKQGENPEEANTMVRHRAPDTFTNLGPDSYNARAKRKGESINRAQRKR